MSVGPAKIFYRIKGRVYRDSMASSANADKPLEESDIVLVGKTGQGKSTTGKKLLRELPGAGDRLLATSRCEILHSSSTSLRIIDTPGLADPNDLTVPVVDSNKEIFSEIIRVQDANDMNIRRFVYFLPWRGALEKSYGSLQEELRMMHSVFGAEVFDNMVVVATNQPPKKYQALGFDEDDKKRTMHAFHEALKVVIGHGKIKKCPPIIYIGLEDNGENILENIKSAEVILQPERSIQFNDHLKIHSSSKNASPSLKTLRDFVAPLQQKCFNYLKGLKALLPSTGSGGSASPDSNSQVPSEFQPPGDPGDSQPPGNSPPPGDSQPPGGSGNS